MTTNNPIPPLFCSTPPPDDFTNQEVEDDDDDFGEFETTEVTPKNQVDAQTLKFPKDVEEVGKGMSTFTLCDDEDEEFNDLKLTKPGIAQGDIEDDSIDFKIEEIQAQETEEVHQSSDDHQVYNVSWPSDESAEINDVGLEDEDVKPDEDDFGTFQDFTETATQKSSNEEIKEDNLNSNLESKFSTEKNTFENVESNNLFPGEIDSQIIQNEISDRLFEEKNKRIENEFIANEAENITVEDFDDFESFPISKTVNTIEFQPVIMQPQAEQFEADFSQFSAFQEPEKTAEPEPEDDFDDFQDFTSAPTIQAPALAPVETFPQFTPLITNISERILPVLDMMFPKSSDSECNEENRKCVLKNPNFLKQIDSSLALNFQWNTSDIRKSLVESIGVDSAAISFQENWNPSMPRFAANLGIAPLEPLKPIKTDVVQIKNTSPKDVDDPKSAPVEKVKISDIPTVEFDWNNTIPGDQLNGSTEVHSSRKTEEIHSTQLGKPNDEYSEQSSQVSDIQIPPEFGSSIPNSISSATPIVVSKKQQVITESNTNVDFGLTNALQPETPAAATSTTYSGTFKETHIFTPAKTEGITRSRTKSKSPIDFDFETAAAGIIIDEKVINKEYRDVEYKPPTPPPPKVPPANVLSIDDEFSDFQSVSVAQQPPQKVPVNIQKIKETESRTSTPNSLIEAEMILSPAVLLPQTVRIENSKPKVEWPEPGIDPEEMARFEQIFSKEKQVSNIEEDDWSEFVSNTEPTNSSNTYHEDEWSEFVSSVPVQPQFNSGAWQNANYYNNPLSVYASTHSNFVPNENNNNISMMMANNSNSITNNTNATNSQPQTTNLNKNQFLNYNKVAPSISLIPDLGFVAPPNVSSGRFLNNFQNANFPRK